jgi:GR25 family glycosyltransferase involved in LPS biosynthesis
LSQKHLKECIQSCEKVEQPYIVWPGFDGTAGEIQVPEQCANNDFFKIIKVTDHWLTRTEVACALSHISLWFHCITIDEPIIILEHDAIMVDKIEHHDCFNSIIWLGSKEVLDNNPLMPIPPHGCAGHNYHYILRAHAYAIDPIVAKNLLAYVIQMGINNPLDLMMRADLFNIIHKGLIAYDKNESKFDTTMKNRNNETRPVIRNDYLQF